jgi:hypothetical protein
MHCAFEARLKGAQTVALVGEDEGLGFVACSEVVQQLTLLRIKSRTHLKTETTNQTEKY